MDLFHRYFTLHRVLSARRLPVSRRELESRLECSRATVKRKIEKILAADHFGAGELAKRVRILRMAGRGPGGHFQRVAGALIERRRLRIRYLARTSGETSDREISPQRLTHYRDNWYLDAWCHMRKALRSFALERIAHAERLTARAVRISERDLDRHFASAYGIFAGEPKEVALLRFSPERARWVSEEVWHPRQEGRFLPDGTYELCLPYGDPRELLMDILRHGAQVEVVAPDGLRAAVADELGRAASRYR